MTHEEALARIKELERLGRELIQHLDTQPGWAMEWGPDGRIVEPFRIALGMPHEHHSNHLQADKAGGLMWACGCGLPLYPCPSGSLFGKLPKR